MAQEPGSAWRFLPSSRPFFLSMLVVVWWGGGIRSLWGILSQKGRGLDLLHMSKENSSILHFESHFWFV